MKEFDNQIEKIILKYERLVYNICLEIVKNKENAENLSQETFLSFYTNKNKYMSLPNEEIKNIICKIALNKCRDYLKSLKEKMQEEAATLDDEIMNNDFDLEEEILKKERRKFIQNITMTLKSPYKEVIYEYYIQDLCLDEVSKKLNINKATLKVQISRAKEMLKKKIIEEGGMYYESKDVKSKNR